MSLMRGKDGGQRRRICPEARRSDSKAEELGLPTWQCKGKRADFALQGKGGFGSANMFRNRPNTHTDTHTHTDFL